MAAPRRVRLRWCFAFAMRIAPIGDADYAARVEPVNAARPAFSGV